MLGGDWEEDLSSMMMGKGKNVATDAAEAVPSSGMVRLDRSVQTRLFVLSRCKAIKVDMINSKNRSKWVCGSIALYEPPKDSWRCEACHIEFALPKMLCETLIVLCADSSQMLLFGLSLKIRRDSVSCPYSSLLNNGLV